MQSRWIRTPVLFRSRACFHLAAIGDLVLPGIRSWFIPSRFRSIAFVQANYDRERHAELARFEASPPLLDTYVFGDHTDSDFVLLNGRTQYGPLSAARRHIANVLLGHVTAHTAPGDTVVEFGCGNGRNLIHLKRMLPDRTYVGLELSPHSVELCRKAAEHYACPIRFEAHDVTKQLEIDLPRPRVCFSVHALEQMPRGFEQAFRNMLATNPQSIIMLEPVHELYHWTVRGVLGSLRARVMDRLTGLPRFLQELPVTVARAEPLGFADNPLNETCVLIVSTQSPSRQAPSRA